MVNLSNWILQSVITSNESQSQLRSFPVSYFPLSTFHPLRITIYLVSLSCAWATGLESPLRAKLHRSIIANRLIILSDWVTEFSNPFSSLSHTPFYSTSRNIWRKWFLIPAAFVHSIEKYRIFTCFECDIIWRLLTCFISRLHSYLYTILYFVLLTLLYSYFPCSTFFIVSNT